LVALIIFYFVFRVKINGKIKEESSKITTRYQDNEGEDFTVTLEESINTFKIGKRQRELKVDQNVSVYSTSKYLLVYKGNGKNQNDFYIQRDGDKNHQENVTYLKLF
jgi:hypothetical protein